MGKRKLSKQNFEEIRKDAAGSSMLTDGQVNAIATKLNKVVNIPILGERLEQKVFAKLVRLVDKKVYELVPNEYYELIKDVHDGISDEDAAKLEERLTPLINDKVNIPILSERMEAKVIAIVLGFIVNAMRKNFNLEEELPE